MGGVVYGVGLVTEQHSLLDCCIASLLATLLALQRYTMSLPSLELTSNARKECAKNNERHKVSHQQLHGEEQQHNLL